MGYASPPPPPTEPGPSCNSASSGLGFVIGVSMGVCGSIGINIGQNLQAAGIQSLDMEDRTKPHKSRTWIIGTTIFVVFSLINFAALALAPASVLTPLESIQFVTNVLYNRVVNKAVVSARMNMGVACACVGTVLSVVFGAQPKGCNSLQQLQSYWQSGLWWTYLAISLSIAVVAFATLRVYTRKELKGEAPAGGALIRPIAFTFSSALAGGAQMIVHSKVLSELMAMIFQGQVSVFQTWLLYVELLLVIVCGIIWVVKLTECLGLFDPLLILPLMVGTYILFGGIAGGIYFEEFASLHLTGSWPLYITGMLLVLCGLGLIADASVRLEEQNAMRFADGGAAASVSSPTTSTKRLVDGEIGSPLGSPTPGPLPAEAATTASSPYGDGLRPPPLSVGRSFGRESSVLVDLNSGTPAKLARLRSQSSYYLDRDILVYQMPSPMVMVRSATMEKRLRLSLTPDGKTLPRRLNASPSSSPAVPRQICSDSPGASVGNKRKRSSEGNANNIFGRLLFGANAAAPATDPPTSAEKNRWFV